MEEERIQKFKDLILNEHYCEDCNELCSIGEAFPLEFVAKYIIKLENENKLLKKVDNIVEKIDTEKLMLKIEDDIEENIENLIEELTKVRPSMLNEEALKLFNTIMAILDERDKLREENELMNVRIKTKLRIAQEEYKEFNEKGQHQLALVISGKIGVLQELLEGE